MTMPNEEVYALKRTRNFLRDLLPMRKTHFAKMTPDEFKEWRNQVYYCLKHYPMDHTISERWADVVCEECGECIQFGHKIDCSQRKPPIVE